MDDRRTILIADDEAYVRDFLNRTLRHEYDLILPDDGFQAIELCRSRTNPIHVAILDVVMPGMNGFELLSCLRELYPLIRPIFMSGYNSDEAFDRAGLSRDTASFLAKPFTVRQLREAIRSELAMMGADQKKLSAS